MPPQRHVKARHFLLVESVAQNHSNRKRRCATGIVADMDELKPVKADVESVMKDLKATSSGPTDMCAMCHMVLPVADMASKLHPDGSSVYICPDCAPQIEDRQREEREEKVSAYVAQSIGARYADVTWMDVVALDNVRFSVVVPCPSLWLYGPGKGKTTMAAVMFRESFLLGEVKPAYFSAPDLIDWLAQVKAESGSTADGIAQLREHELLIIDDLGSTTDFGYEVICRVIDWRYRDNARTIVCTRYLSEDIAEAYGNRMADQIAEMCGEDGFIEFPDTEESSNDD